MVAKPLLIFGDGEQARDFVFVKDVVRGLVAAGSAPQVSGHVYNIAAGRPTTILELAQVLSEVAGASLSVEHFPVRPGDIVDSWADISAARIDLGFSATTLLEGGLRETMRRFERKGAVCAGAVR